MAAGSSVTITGLSARPELNGRVGYLLTGELKAGRVVVVVGNERFKLKPANAVPRLPPAVAEVLASPALLPQILPYLARWEIWGRCTGVTKIWRAVCRDRDWLWRRIVVVPAHEVKPSGHVMAAPESRMPGNARHVITRHMHHNSLPLYAAELDLIPDLALVTTLIIPGSLGRYEEGGESPDLIPMATEDIESMWDEWEIVDEARLFHLSEMRMICQHFFPSLKELYCNFRDADHCFPGMVEVGPFPAPFVYCRLYSHV